MQPSQFPQQFPYQSGSYGYYQAPSLQGPANQEEQIRQLTTQVTELTARLAEVTQTVERLTSNNLSSKEKIKKPKNCLKSRHQDFKVFFQDPLTRIIAVIVFIAVIVIKKN